MDQRFTPEQLNRMDHKTKDGIICQMQERLDRLEQDYENLVEQIRLANQERFGRKTEKLDEIAGQLSFFNEAEACFSETAEEPAMEEVVARAVKPARKQKKKGQREEDLKDFPQEEICHDIPEEELDDSFGKGNWKGMPDEVFWQLRFEPAKWVAEKHVVKVYVGPWGPSGDVIPWEHCDPVAGGSGAECQICQQQSPGPYREGFPGERSEPVKADDVELDGVDSGEIPPAGL